MAHETRESYYLAILDSYEVIIIDRADTPEIWSMVARLGGRSPVHATASGQVLIADSPPECSTRIIERSGLKRFTPEDDHERRAAQEAPAGGQAPRLFGRGRGVQVGPLRDVRARSMITGEGGGRADDGDPVRTEEKDGGGGPARRHSQEGSHGHFTRDRVRGGGSMNPPTTFPSRSASSPTKSRRLPRRASGTGSPGASPDMKSAAWSRAAFPMSTRRMDRPPAGGQAGRRDRHRAVAGHLQARPRRMSAELERELTDVLPRTIVMARRVRRAADHRLRIQARGSEPARITCSPSTISAAPRTREPGRDDHRHRKRAGLPLRHGDEHPAHHRGGGVPSLGANWDPCNAYGTDEVPFPDGYDAINP